MKLVTFAYENQTRIGALVGLESEEYIFDCTPIFGNETGMVELLRLGQAGLDAVQAELRKAGRQALLSRKEVTLLAPVPRPGKIICLGHNYLDHMGIGRLEPPKFPTFFGKFANTVIGPDQPVLIPPVTKEVDYEAELAVVIGSAAWRVSEAEAYSFIAGYTIFNDISARDYQKRTSQWMIGKNFDTFGPMGPVLVTRDEIPDPHDLDLSLTLNKLEMQRTHTSHMIFSIPYLVAVLSEVMTLEPGDVISTGTPAKTELARQVEPGMKPGDVVSITIEPIGTLTNPIAARA